MFFFCVCVLQIQKIEKESNNNNDLTVGERVWMENSPIHTTFLSSEAMCLRKRTKNLRGEEKEKSVFALGPKKK